VKQLCEEKLNAMGTNKQIVTVSGINLIIMSKNLQVSTLHNTWSSDVLLSSWTQNTVTTEIQQCLVCSWGLDSRSEHRQTQIQGHNFFYLQTVLLPETIIYYNTGQMNRKGMLVGFWMKNEGWRWRWLPAYIYRQMKCKQFDKKCIILQQKAVSVMKIFWNHSQESGKELITYFPSITNWVFDMISRATLYYTCVSQ
jgi:hypothetical protein